MSNRDTLVESQRYTGQERRTRKVYVTRNTEYHLDAGVCVAVRDRATKRFQRAHIALRLKMEGAVRVYPTGAAVPVLGEARAGDAIYFNHPDPEGEERQIVTSRIEMVGRPPKRDVLSYPALTRG